MRNNNTAFRRVLTNEGYEWFSRALLGWYQIHQRNLPWRETRDPFRIWLSEIILQQTRVNQGLPYYHQFVEAYENIEAFAAADLDEILKLWQGLGYYSRARNMHECARNIVDELGGSFPATYMGLQELKGIGKYTAAAIASICFNEAVPTIDGNAFRVLARVFGITQDISKGSTFKVFFELGKLLISKDNPGDFNQAMMELGAVVCLPKSPRCEMCVLSSHCLARKHDMVDDLPVKSKKVKVRQRYFNYMVYVHGTQVLMRKRQTGDIWAGLYEFDLRETKKSLKRSSFAEAKLHYSSASIIHQLTHQKLHIQFHVYEVNNSAIYEKLKQECQLHSIERSQIKELAVPKPIELFLNNEFCK